MKTIVSLALVSMMILPLCSCSAPSDTAQVPESAPVNQQVSPLEPNQLSERQPETQQPAQQMARQLGFLGEEEQAYLGDSFLETQASFEQNDSDEIPLTNQFDFSHGLILDTE